jgi:ABC-type sugar transport system substrate-binding protein
MVVTLAGCSSAATPAPASQTPAPASQTPAPASQTPAQQRTLGIVDFSETSSMSHMYSLSDKKIFEAAGWQTVMLDPNGDITKANTICQQLVQRKVDVIIIDVFLPSEMALCLTTAKSAGIPVFGNSISLAAGITGGAINTFTAKELNDRFLKDAASLGITDLLEINYHPGAPCLARTTSLDAMLASHPEIKVTAVEVAVPGQVQSAQDFTKAFLTSHPAKAGQGLGIWACWSEPAFGSLAAIKQLGRTDSIPIWTWDISQATLDPIRTGEIAAALTFDTVGMANQMLGMVNGYLQSPSTWQPQEVSATSFVVDKATLDQFLAQHADVVTP